MLLKLGGNQLTLGGQRLTLGAEGAVAEVVIRSGGWLPIIYVDKKNRPISLEDAAQEAVAAAPEAIKAEVQEIAARVVDPALVGAAVSAAMLADIMALADALQASNAALAEAMQRAAELHWLAMEDEAAAFLLLMA